MMKIVMRVCSVSLIKDHVELNDFFDSICWICVRESRWKLDLIVFHMIKMGMRHCNSIENSNEHTWIILSIEHLTRDNVLKVIINDNCFTYHVPVVWHIWNPPDVQTIRFCVRFHQINDSDTYRGKLCVFIVSFCDRREKIKMVFHSLNFEQNH